jgi:hypothetical protein
MHSLKLAVVGVPYAGSIVFSRKKKKPPPYALPSSSHLL